MKVDMKLGFKSITYPLVSKIKEFEPLGSGNPAPSFVSYAVKVRRSKLVGSDQRHLKLTLEENGKVFDAIAFNFGHMVKEIEENKLVDVVYNLEENHWNGDVNLQLKVKDIKASK